MKAALLSIAFALAGLAGPATAQCITIRYVSGCAPAAYYPAPGTVTTKGYWTVQKRRVYVPAHWNWYSYSYGVYRKRWVPACYNVVSQRVWIPACAPAYPTYVCIR